MTNENGHKVLFSLYIDDSRRLEQESPTFSQSEVWLLEVQPTDLQLWLVLFSRIPSYLLVGTTFIPYSCGTCVWTFFLHQSELSLPTFNSDKFRGERAREVKGGD